MVNRSLISKTSSSLWLTNRGGDPAALEADPFRDGGRGVLEALDEAELWLEHVVRLVGDGDVEAGEVDTDACARVLAVGEAGAGSTAVASSSVRPVAVRSACRRSVAVSSASGASAARISPSRCRSCRPRGSRPA